MRSTFYKYLALFLVVAISTLTAFLLLEIGIRWSEKISHSQKPPAFFKSFSEESNLKNKVKETGISSDTFNIYYFGESSMWGEPYLDTIPIIVEKMLGDKIDGKEIKWVNTAEPGLNFDEVSSRLRLVVDQKDFYLPSLIIVYAGHDEFLKYQDNIGFSIVNSPKSLFGKLISQSRLISKLARSLRLYRLEIDDRHFFDTPVVTSAEYDSAIRHFKDMVQSAASSLEKNQIPAIFSTVAGNYTGFDPNRSQYTGDQSRRDQFQQFMDQGLVAENNEKVEEALSNYQKAAAIDSRFAETQYRLGRVYQKLNQNDKAWDAYSLAVDNDMMPIRATSSQNRSILEIGNSQHVKVVDTVSYLRDNSPHSLIGNNLFADGHHPNLEGYRLIAELFSKKIKDMYPQNTQLGQLSPSEAEAIFNTDSRLYSLYTSRAGWLIRLSTWRYDPEQRLKDAQNYLNKEGQLYEGDCRWNLSKMTIAYLQKNLSDAKKYYEVANKADPVMTRQYLQNDWINQIIARALN